MGIIVRCPLTGLIPCTKTINFPRPYGRGINLSQTSFALHLSCLDSQCRLGLHSHLYPLSRRSIRPTIPHLYPNIFALRTGIFASSAVTCSVLLSPLLFLLPSLAESIPAYVCGLYRDLLPLFVLVGSALLFPPTSSRYMQKFLHLLPFVGIL